jgi:hypothetical protein
MQPEKDVPIKKIRGPVPDQIEGQVRVSRILVCGVSVAGKSQRQ